MASSSEFCPKRKLGRATRSTPEKPITTVQQSIHSKGSLITKCAMIMVKNGEEKMRTVASEMTSWAKQNQKLYIQ